MALTEIIPAQAFERIRDRICEILTTELNAQNVLSAFEVPVIWKERFIPFNETEIPAVNVNIQNGVFDNETVVRSEGTYIFNIDIYTNSETTDETGAGNQYAMIKMNRLLGKICAILRHPNYVMLGFPKGTVSKRKVERFFIGDKQTVKDALSNVVGRVQLMVVGIETNEVYTPVPLNVATTVFRFTESSLGYKTEITNLNSNHENEYSNEYD